MILENLVVENGKRRNTKRFAVSIAGVQLFEFVRNSGIQVLTLVGISS